MTLSVSGVRSGICDCLRGLKHLDDTVSVRCLEWNMWLSKRVEASWWHFQCKVSGVDIWLSKRVEASWWHCQCKVSGVEYVIVQECWSILMTLSVAGVWRGICDCLRGLKHLDDTVSVRCLVWNMWLSKRVEASWWHCQCQVSGVEYVIVWEDWGILMTLLV